MPGPAITDLSPEERLALIAELWDSLDEADVPLSEAQRAELDRRLETAEADARVAKSWEELERALKRRGG